jgi:threonine dehydrogenase-like Zn-dependent dehydrogenase
MQALIWAGGTDLHICADEHPRAKPGIVLGHEISGQFHRAYDVLPAGTKVVVDPLLPCGRCPTCRYGRPYTCANLRLLATGAVDPAPLATVFPLARWQDAFAAMQARGVVKALLDPRHDDDHGAAP